MRRMRLGGLLIVASCLLRATSASPSAPADETPPPEALEAALEGLRRNEAGRFEEAILLHERAVRLWPTASTFANLGRAQLGVGRPLDALASLDRAVQLDPRRPWGRIYRAAALAALGKEEQALRECDEAVRIDSRLGDAYAARARIRWIRGDGEGAVVDARTALDLQGWRHPDAGRRAIVAHLGFRTARRDDEARRVLDEAASNAAEGWPHAALRFLRGEIDAEALLGEARTDTGGAASPPRRAAERLTEARTYVGIDRALAGETASALDHLRWVREDGAVSVDARALAVAALRRIEAAQEAAEAAVRITAATPGGVRTVNGSRPGERIDLPPHLVPGKTTIFDFYSEHCPPCRRLSGLLRTLADRRPNVAVRKVNIDRRGADGIDWGSPVVQQYGIRSVPHVKIFGPDGTLVAEGDEGSRRVYRMIEEAGIR